MSAADLRVRLGDLLTERAVAMGEGCSEDGLVVRAIDADVAAHRVAYTATAVTEIAVLRRQLGDFGAG